MKRIGVLTSGGDSPGMNAAIRSVTRYAVYKGIEVMGIYNGFEGLIKSDFARFTHRSVSNIISRGGTILKTARCKEFTTTEGRSKAKDSLEKHGIDGLVVIGGNGSYRGAHIFGNEFKIPCIGVPATIDNDIEETDATIGSDTAVNTALHAIDNIRDTATSLERIFIVEVMGRESGFIAKQVGLGGGAEDIIIPEMNYDLEMMCEDINKGHNRGKISWIIIVAEGAAKSRKIAKEITKKTGFNVRLVVLGHIQRGGSPTAFDRILATRLGAAAVSLLADGQADKAVGIKADKINVVDFKVAIQEKKEADIELYKLLRILT
ncbi:MAG: 6-phosphofructokinase [bacterium]|nr:6-phosphofructokinase [bacterium]